MSTVLRSYSWLDRCLLQFDQGLRTVLGKSQSNRANPADQVYSTKLLPQDQRLSARLMRVNHAGEIAAQALYQGQALTARNKITRERLQQSAQEETDHLAWCEQRLQELNAHTSYLNGLWYLGSLMIGISAGLAGDQWNLGFIVETEQQVVNHLDKHLQRLPKADHKSRFILEQMHVDEAHHATIAAQQGSKILPKPIKLMMHITAKIMTKTAYWI